MTRLRVSCRAYALGWVGCVVIATGCDRPQEVPEPEADGIARGVAMPSEANERSARVVRAAESEPSVAPKSSPERTPDSPVEPERRDSQPPEAPAGSGTGAMTLPTVTPRLTVSEFRSAAGARADVEQEACPYEVDVQGLDAPVVSVDGSRVAYWVAEHLTQSEAAVSIAALRITDVATDRIETKVVIEDENRPDPRPSTTTYEDPQLAQCHARWKAARRRARTANLALAKHRWRAMPLVSVWMRDRTQLGDLLEHEGAKEATAKLDALPPEKRPVELTVHRGNLVVRVRGVEVLARIPADWKGTPYDGPDESCTGFTVVPVAMFGDRPTGVALLDVRQVLTSMGDCEAETLFHPVVLPPEVWHAIDERKGNTPAQEPWSL